MPDLDQRATRRRGEIAAWILLAVLTTWMSVRVIGHDWTDRPVVGDQAGNVLQMLSIAHDDHNLSYDVDDIHRWRALHWTNNPHGLYFQANDDGWAFAKPYGYSLVTAVPYRLFGAPTGVGVANAVLLVGLVGLAVATLRLWLRGAAVPLVAAAFVFASNAYLHAFYPVVDLFTAVVVAVAVYALLRGCRDEALPWSLVGFAAVGFALSEKIPLLLALAPLCGVALWHARDWLRRAAMVGVAVVVFGIAIVPYLYYSDGASWTAYGGERYYASGVVPWDPESDVEPLRVDSDETISVSYIASSLTSGWADTAESALYYLVGRHTGLLVGFPVALGILGVALARVRSLPPEALAALAGLGAYIAFYLVLFPDNYYGGGQAMANRYFLQVSPLLLAVAAAGRLPTKALVISSFVAAAASLTFMWPHHAEPDWALRNLDETAPAQSWLPFESNQLGADYWRCGFGVCDRTADG